MILPHFRKRGFTLIELLVVMAIIAILSAISLAVIPALSRSGQVNRTLAEVTGILEQARQYAVAQNTYVWVAFLSPDSTKAYQMDVAVIASADGTEINLAGTGTPPGPTTWGGTPSLGSSLFLVSKVQTCPFINLAKAGTVTPAQPPTATGTDLASTADFNIVVPGNPSATIFTEALEFTPTGAVRVTTETPVSLIEFDLQPYKGSGVIDTHNGAVIQINGLTGSISVYRQ